MSSSPVLKSVRDKVGLVVADNRRLREQAGKLDGQNQRLRDENRELAQQIVTLQQRIAVLETKGVMGSGEDDKLARARVNRLMREVDKCIELVNRDQ